jgi:hypothetical protein
MDIDQVRSAEGANRNKEKHERIKLLKWAIYWTCGLAYSSAISKEVLHSGIGKHLPGV